jgi:hypothetical protein
MRSEFVKGVTVRPLRNGETAAVQAVFDALGPESRLRRFGGAKNILSPADLELLSRVDANHHVLVACAGGEPIGIARLVREDDTAEVAFVAADARAAGIRRFVADVAPDNLPSHALLRRLRIAAA